MYRLGLVLVFACLHGTGGVRAAPPNPDDLDAPAEIQVKARALVRQLGSEDYQAREDAQSQLADLGRYARRALLEGATASAEPEVRFRCGQLLPAATAQDIAARIDTFLADTKGEYEHHLPGWKAFRATVRSEWALLGRVVWSDRALDTAARQVFADMIAAPANRRLLMAVDGSRVELADLVTARRQAFTGPRGVRGEVPAAPPTLADVTVLLFAESRGGSQYLPRRSPITYLMSESGFTRAAADTDEKGRVYRAVAVAWLNTRDEPREMYQALTVAEQLNLTEPACELAARLLAMPGVTAAYRGRAASELASIGTKKHIPLLDRAATDASVVYSVRKPPSLDGKTEAIYEIQVRDLALAVSILLAEQKLQDYGFTDRYGGNAPAEKRAYTYSRYYFTDDDARKRALAKWADWRKSHAAE
ncbi:hypothetical protein [Frigoriglobus tundricola]|uniref:Uncharacterized protein n=1 Tax=Frigoriglobus tundricola TaxID=2774151 RepID=A0A6M5YVK3_9BACT|nr:hypothetical protein [Frigoriglobus tundricola]QJW98107.1 hypothetical protein FTUN_5687 [Frigoriglobus tundricola]